MSATPVLPAPGGIGTGEGQVTGPAHNGAVKRARNSRKESAPGPAAAGFPGADESAGAGGGLRPGDDLALHCAFSHLLHVAYELPFAEPVPHRQCLAARGRSVALFVVDDLLGWDRAVGRLPAQRHFRRRDDSPRRHPLIACRLSDRTARVALCRRLVPAHTFRAGRPYSGHHHPDLRNHVERCTSTILFSA